MHVAILFGTRPEAIKLAPVIKQLKKQGFKTTVVITSQHREMLVQALDIFKIKPDIDLNVMRKNQSLEYITYRILKKVYKTLEEIKPDVVLVQGDTTSTFASALASYYLGIPVGHIEAGLRTYDKRNPFPEEINRRLTAPLADYNFAPTELSARNLKKENIDPDTIFLTGNTIVDALLYISEKVKKPAEKSLRNLDLSKKIILLTTHRRESFGKDMEESLEAVKSIALHNSDVLVVFPVHKNPKVRKAVDRVLKKTPNFLLTEPLPYTDLIYLLKNCYLILTDSGGIQEEAPTFGKPVLVLRKTTERPEGVKAGVAKLVGTDKNKIVKETTKLLNNKSAYKKMAQSLNPYGDGKSSLRIVEILKTGKLKNPFRG